jgi:hypothetical protein
MFADPTGLLCTGGCGGGSNSTANISANLTITVNPVLIAMLGCTAGQDAQDFVSGVADQLYADIGLQPGITAITIVAHLPPPYGSGFQNYPLISAQNLSTNAEAQLSQLNAKFWAGSGWYKAGRLAGRSISYGIGVYLAATGYVTFEVGLSGEGASLVCEVVSGGACTIPAGVVGVASAGLVVTGVVEGGWGAVIVAANLANPVGGPQQGGGGGGSGKLPDKPVYRGGDDLTPKPYDVRIDKQTGMMRPGYGVSLNTDPLKMEQQFGSAYQVGSIPDGLEIIQRANDLTHYEIVPVYPMTFEQYANLLKQVVLVPYTP